MEFNPNNNVVKLCLQGMGMEEKGKPEEASKLFLQAWNEATYDFEKFISAHYVARYQKSVGQNKAPLLRRGHVLPRLRDDLGVYNPHSTVAY